jgi:hypothetical protein
VLRTYTSVGIALLLAGGAWAAQNPAPPPSQAPLPGLYKQVRGQITAVDPKAGTVTIRSGEDPRVTPKMYHVGKDTRYYGADRNDPLRDGLSNPGFRPGVTVWFRSPLDNPRTIRELGYGALGYGAPGLPPGPPPR